MDDDELEPLECEDCGEPLCSRCGDCHECGERDPRKCVPLSDYMADLDRPFPEEYD